MAKKSKQRYNYTADELSSRIYNVYYNKYYDIFMDSFEWSGIEPEAEDYIMRKLWSKGTIAAFDMKNVGVTFAPYSVSGYGLYDVPTEINIINTRNIPGFPTSTLTNNKDVVIGYIQRNRKSISEFVEYYCLRMTQIDMVLNTNLEVHKMPFLIGLDDADKKAAEDIVEKILNNEIVVFATLEQVNAVKTLVNSAPYILDKLYALKNNYESELLTFLGVDNSNIDVDKLAVDQINANNQMINTKSKGFENELKKFCKKVEEVLGYTISVKSTQELVESVHEDMDKSNSNDESKDETGGTL